MNLIAYKHDHRDNDDKSELISILPGKAALIGDTIYLSDVCAPLKDMMKIVITERNGKGAVKFRRDSIQIESRWNFTLYTVCNEFARFGN